MHLEPRRLRYGLMVIVLFIFFEEEKILLKKQKRCEGVSAAVGVGLRAVVFKNYSFVCALLILRCVAKGFGGGRNEVHVCVTKN